MLFSRAISLLILLEAVGQGPNIGVAWNVRQREGEKEAKK